MKHLWYTLLFLLILAGPAWSQSEEHAEKETEEKERQPAPPPANAEGETPKPEKGAWPPPFTPSEKISADAVISFPTDI